MRQLVRTDSCTGIHSNLILSIKLQTDIILSQTWLSSSKLIIFWLTRQDLPKGYTVTRLVTHVTTVTRDGLSHYWWHLEPVADHRRLLGKLWEHGVGKPRRSLPPAVLAAVSSHQLIRQNNMKIFLVFILTFVIAASQNSVLRNYSRQVDKHFVFRKED